MDEACVPPCEQRWPKDCTGRANPNLQFVCQMGCSTTVCEGCFPHIIWTCIGLVEVSAPPINNHWCAWASCLADGPEGRPESVSGSEEGSSPSALRSPILCQRENRHWALDRLKLGLAVAGSRNHTIGSDPPSPIVPRAVCAFCDAERLICVWEFSFHLHAYGSPMHQSTASNVLWK